MQNRSRDYEHLLVPDVADQLDLVGEFKEGDSCARRGPTGGW
jgi:hypothetical protein